ncbi:MAG: MFS transporter [Candidatus Liptonbacteria bacterium]|nr:MFS transporter [Candidatus Liptonbacteria bacterium]
MEKIWGIKRNVFFLGLVSFFNDFSAEMVHSVMPVFLTMVLGAPAFMVSLIEGVADAASSVLKFLSGYVSDRIQRRKTPAILGYALSVGVRPFLALVANAWQVLGLRFVDRVGKGLRDAPRDALIVESVESHELGKSFGFHRSLDTLGATLGPLAAFLLLPLLGMNFRHLFLVAFVVGLAALLSFGFVRDVRRREAPPPETVRISRWQTIRRTPGFLAVIFAIFVFGLGSLPPALLLLRAKEVGFGIGMIPIVYLIYNLAFVLTAIPLGRLADRIGERTVITAGFGVASLTYFGLAGNIGMAMLIALFVLLGVYSAATDGLQRVLASRFLPASVIGTGQGFLNLAIGFSSLGASIIGGLLWTQVGSWAGLIYAGTLSFLGLILFGWLTRGSMRPGIIK